MLINHSGLACQINYESSEKEPYCNILKTEYLPWWNK